MYAGIEIGATKQQIALIDEKGNLLNAITGKIPGARYFVMDRAYLWRGFTGK